MLAALFLQAAGLLLILAGIVYRGRWRSCRTWPVYLLVGAGHNLLQVAGWATTWEAWITVELTQKILWLVVAVEIASRVFHSGLPGGRARCQLAVLFVLVIGLTAVAAQAQPVLSAKTLLELARRTGVLASWLGLAVLIACALWRWPIHPFHRDILLGSWIYQATFSLFAHQPGTWSVWLYFALIALWAFVAWRPDPDLDWPADLRAATWPWESRA